MADDEVILRGFDMPMSDIGDQLHFRLPLLSFGSSPTLYVAGRVDWHSDRQALTTMDDPEDREVATLFTDGVSRHVTSGQGVIVAGAEFFHAASGIGDQLDNFSLLATADCECRIRVGTPAEFMAIKRDLIDESRVVFDQELGKASRLGGPLTERGNAAMLILRRCGPLRRDDLAIRQLAAAKQNRDFDLYRRLLTRFEHELGEPEDHLHKQVDRHIELAAALDVLRRWADDEQRLAARRNLAVVADLEDTLRIGVSIIESVVDVMHDMDALSVDAKRQCIGQEFEENLRKAAKGVEEIEGMFNSVHDP